MVDKAVQLAMITRFALAPALGCALTFLALELLGGAVCRRAAEAGVEIEGLGATFVIAEVLVAVTLVGLLLNAVLMSYRLAGPAYRIRETLVAFRRGDRARRARLRTGDFHGDLAEEANELLDWATYELAKRRAAAFEPEPAATAGDAARR